VLPDIRKTQRFQGSQASPAGSSKKGNGDQYRVLGEWYWQGTAEIRGTKDNMRTVFCPVLPQCRIVRSSCPLVLLINGLLRAIMELSTDGMMLRAENRIIRRETGPIVTTCVYISHGQRVRTRASVVMRGRMGIYYRGHKNSFRNSLRTQCASIRKSDR
jgi:hypothetical protein